MSREIAVEGLAVQSNAVRVFDQAGLLRCRARGGDADRAARAGLAFDDPDEVADRVENRGVIVRRRRCPPAHQNGSVIVERDRFDFGPAQIDADAHLWIRSPDERSAIRAP